MADETLESGQEVVEAQETPTPEVPSVPSGDKLPSAEPRLDAAALAEKLEQLEKKFEELPTLVERSIQSTKDRRFAALEGLDPDLLRKFKNYLDQYGDEDRAIREMQVDEMLARESRPSGRGGSDARGTERMSRYARRVLPTAGIDFDDPESKQLVQRASANWNVVGEEGLYDMLDQFVDSITTKQAKQSGITPAAAASPAGATPTGRSVEEIAAELERVQRLDPKNVELRKQLLKELREAESS